MTAGHLLAHQAQLWLLGRYAFLQHPLDAGIEFLKLIKDFILADVEFFQERLRGGASSGHGGS